MAELPAFADLRVGILMMDADRNKRMRKSRKETRPMGSLNSLPPACCRAIIYQEI
jgi:hypothetical protein